MFQETLGEPPVREPDEGRGHPLDGSSGNGSDPGIGKIPGKEEREGEAMIPELREAFASIGAQATMDVAGRSFSVEVIASGKSSLFKIQIPVCGLVKVRAVEVDRLRQSLVLEVQDGRSTLQRRYRCALRDGRWTARSLSTALPVVGRRASRTLVAGAANAGSMVGRVRDSA